MAQNILHNAWSEKIVHAMEEDVEDSVRKTNPALRRNFNSENETFFNNATNANDNGLVPNMNLPEDSSYQRRSRSSRYIPNDEMEFDAPNLTLKHTPSSDTLYSRGSRNLSRHSPVGSYRSIRTSAMLHSPLSKRDNRDGINIIMLIGFAIGIACGIIFNIAEVYLKWFQTKITETQMRFFGGKSIHNFYLQEESMGKKILYGPLGGLLIILQSIVYVILISIDFLKKPAPKTLVANVMMRYINE